MVTPARAAGVADKVTGRLRLLAPVLVPQLRTLVRSSSPAELAAQLAPVLAVEFGTDAAALAAVLLELGEQLRLLRPPLTLEP